VATRDSDDGSRAQRILAYVFGGLIVVTVIAFFAIVLGQIVGPDAGGFDSGIWPAVFLTPLIALPAALLVLLTLIALIARRRARDAAAHAAVVASRKQRRP
jgi:H+/Cl- antiporter ClcA